MKRSLTLPLAALALSACGGEPPAERTTVTAPAPAPVVAAPAPCVAETAAVPAFPITAATRGDHLSPELLETPSRGRCETGDLLFSQIDAMPRSLSTISTERGPVLTLHRLHAAAVLPAQKLVIVAAETGVWALDAGTMARVARLAPHRAVDVVATPDGRRFAYVRQDPAQRDSDEASEPRELVIVDAAYLSVVRRVRGVPEGRLRLSNDGRLVLIARGEDGVTTIDVASGRDVSFPADLSAEDAFASAERDGLVGYVGKGNVLAFRDVRSGANVPQSSVGGLPLASTNDLATVVNDPAGHRWLVGGQDEQVHEYVGMPGDAPRDARQVHLRGTVVDVAIGANGSYVAATGEGQLAVVKDGAIVRDAGPFLPEAADSPVRLGLIGEDTFVAMDGRIFSWTRDGRFVAADFLNGQELARAELGNDLILVIRSHGVLEFHRVPKAGGLVARTTLIGRAEWQDVDAQFTTAAGEVLFVGRAYTHAAIAIVPASGEARVVRGPQVGVGPTPVAVPRGDGVQWGLWDLQGSILTIDTVLGTIRATHTVAGERLPAGTLSVDGDGWKLVDANGQPRALTEIPATPAVP